MTAFKSAAAIGSFHKSAESGRITPRDARKWNKRVETLEALLRANSIWRAPHTKETVCIISCNSSINSGSSADNKNIRGR